MKIRHRALVVLTILALLFAVGIASSTWFLLQSNQSLSNVRKEIRVVLAVIDPINHSRTMRVRLAQAMANQHAGSADVARTAIDAAQEALTKSKQAFQDYVQNPKLEGEAALADAYATKYQAYLDDALLPMMDAARTGNQERFEHLTATIVPTLDRQFELALLDLLAFREQHARSLNERAQNQFTLSLVVLTVLTALFLTVTGVIFVWLSKTLLASLNEASRHCTDIAHGDLRSRIVPRSRDEIGQMMLALEGMRQSLASTIERVLNASQSVAHGSREIAAGNADLSARTETQAASLEETAASMTQLTQTTRQNADNASQANELAGNATHIAETSDNTVQSMVATVAEIGKSAEKVADITNLIEGIAFQTNILALNAAVEAARAGENGRGFAVVASEVRSLAQRSGSAAKEIKELIDNSVGLARSGSGQAVAVGESMSEVAQAIKRLRDIVGEIAGASEEQARGIEQVYQAIAQMDEVTQQNAALVEEAAAAAQSLDEQANNLKGAVSVFKLAERPTAM
jgi:methyl-accepting chemotaxis protein-3 (ribose and galactose sensor receptor)